MAGRRVAELRNPIYGRCLVFRIFTGGRARTRAYRGHSAALAFGGCSRRGRERVRMEERSRVGARWPERRMD